MTEDDKFGYIIAALIFAALAGPFLLGMLIGSL